MYWKDRDQPADPPWLKLDLEKVPIVNSEDTSRLDMPNTADSMSKGSLVNVQIWLRNSCMECKSRGEESNDEQKWLKDYRCFLLRTAIDDEPNLLPCKYRLEYKLPFLKATRAAVAAFRSYPLLQAIRCSKEIWEQKLRKTQEVIGLDLSVFEDESVHKATQLVEDAKEASSET